MSIEFRRADWRWRPAGVEAGHTTRVGGVSTGSYATANLGDHVGDEGHVVAANRQALAQRLGLARIQWLDQVHGTHVVVADPDEHSAPRADACWTDAQGLAIAIMSADCVPVVLADAGGGFVGAAHCGWRGTVAGVIEALAAALPHARGLQAWIGPAICGRCYEVGADVTQALDSIRAAKCLTRSHVVDDRDEQRWLLDLPLYVEMQLLEIGVQQVARSPLCTHHDGLYSYRRDGATGRFATLAWLSNAA